MTEALMLNVSIPEWVEVAGDDDAGWNLWVEPQDVGRLVEWLDEVRAVASTISVSGEPG